MAKNINLIGLGKRVLALMLAVALVMSISSIGVIAVENADNTVQIVEKGGANPQNGLNKDGVSVSKTIAATDKENYFDITLEVVTTNKVEEIYKAQDIAVVIVMDISNTMNSMIGKTNVSRYSAAMSAAETFINTFANYSKGTTADRKLGFVAFNTHAHEVFAMSTCATAKQASTLISEMKSKTGKIINASNYASSVDRFTNIEAGLKRADDMLDKAKIDNRYIIFLSDGFPTTYISSGYTGVNPYDGDGSHLNNDKKGKPCTYGTSYSDRAADKAQKLAAKIKKDTTIFSIGVDVSGQTIAAYEKADVNNVKAGFSVIDCYKNGYIIKDGQFEKWLGNTIGSGYYYSSSDSKGLTAAYNTIFAEIREITQNEVKASWVVNDAMNDGKTENIEFLHFYNKKGKAAGTSLNGAAEINGENTAEYVANTDSIRWDMKKSGYTVKTESNVTTYTYTLKYRVRLMNENGGFKVEDIYKTNGPTSLTYQIRTENGISNEKKIDFPIPSVKGYLGTLEFEKTNAGGKALAGAEFTLKHSGKSCPVCGGDATIGNKTATSDNDGKVTFKNIPSGHTYTLSETEAPEGYIAANESFSVTVSYGTVKLTNNSGKEVSRIKNERIPEETTVTTPEESTATTPEESTATTPEESTVTTPEETTVTTPEESTATTPEESTATTPEESTATTPEETTATTPEESTATTPEETTVITPEETTATTPEETTATTPEESTVTTPEETTVTTPEETTKKKPIGRIITTAQTTTTAPKEEPEETTTVTEETTTIPEETTVYVPEETTAPEEIEETTIEETTTIPEETTTETEVTTTVPEETTKAVELIEIPEEDVPLTDIPDEDVPKTGDTYMWFGISALSATGLMVLHLYERKKKEENS